MSDLKDVSMEELISRFNESKKLENDMKVIKQTVEAEIICRLGSPPGDSLSKVHDVENNKITVKRSVTWKIDQKKYAKKRDELKDEFRPEKIKYDLDVAKYKLLCKTQSEIKEYLSDCVSFKDNKTSITIKEV